MKHLLSIILIICVVLVPVFALSDFNMVFTEHYKAYKGMPADQLIELDRVSVATMVIEASYYFNASFDKFILDEKSDHPAVIGCDEESNSFYFALLDKKTQMYYFAVLDFNDGVLYYDDESKLSHSGVLQAYEKNFKKFITISAKNIEDAYILLQNVESKYID